MKLAQIIYCQLPIVEWKSQEKTKIRAQFDIINIFDL